MAYLFILENNIAKPNPETLLISPFRDIWERDTSPDKSQAIKEFSFIELMSSKRKTNPYAGYSDEQRFYKLRETLKFPFDWKPDILIEQCLAKIEEFQTEGSFNYMMYKQSLDTVMKTREYLIGIDLNERTKSGMPVYKPADVYSAVEKVEKIMTSLNTLKEKVEQELFDTSRTRGNKAINPLEN